MENQILEVNSSHFEASIRTSNSSSGDDAIASAIGSCAQDTLDISGCFWDTIVQVGLRMLLGEYLIDLYCTFSGLHHPKRWYSGIFPKTTWLFSGWWHVHPRYTGPNDIALYLNIKMFWIWYCHEIVKSFSRTWPLFWCMEWGNASAVWRLLAPCCWQEDA